MKNKRENNFPIKESEVAGLNNRVNKLAIKSGISLTPEQQKLIEDNIGWLEGVVRDELKKLRGRFTYHTYNDLLSDLLQEGAIGLIKAALNFDPNVNTLFRTYAERRVRGAVLDYLRRIDPLGRDSRKLIKSIEDIKDNFYRKFGRLPTDEEVAKELGISPEVYKKRYRNIIPPKFVDIDDVDIQSHIINFENFLNETLDRDKKEHILKEILESNILSDDERKVIMLYLNNNSFDVIAKQLGISYSIVVSKMDTAINKISKEFEKRGYYIPNITKPKKHKRPHQKASSASAF